MTCFNFSSLAEWHFIMTTAALLTGPSNSELRLIFFVSIAACPPYSQQSSIHLYGFSHTSDVNLRLFCLPFTWFQYSHFSHFSDIYYTMRSSKLNLFRISLIFHFHDCVFVYKTEEVSLDLKIKTSQRADHFV